MIKQIENYYHQRACGISHFLCAGREWLLITFESGDVGVVGVEAGTYFVRILAESYDEAVNWIREDIAE